MAGTLWSPSMEALRDDVAVLSLFPRAAINVYVVGDVLIDAGVRQTTGKLLGALAGRAIAAHALTHAHPDHVGGSDAVVRTLGVPCWAPAGEAAGAAGARGGAPAGGAAAAAAGRPPAKPGPLGALLARGAGWTPVPVARE